MLKYQYHAVSAMDESNIGHVGRPFGGCAIIWHKDLALSIIPVDTTSPKLCAVVIKSDRLNTLMCNVYMPCDNNTDDNYEIYGDILYEILTLFEVYRGYDFIIGGDFNVDFSRNNSRKLRLLNQFINEEQLICVSLNCPNNEYTYQDERMHRSFIDHFIVSESLSNCNIYVSHDGDNLSDHEPIIIRNLCISNMIIDKNYSWHGFEWNKATDEHIREYKNLDSDLSHLAISENIIDCDEVNCR